MPQIMTYIVDVNGPLSLVITSDLMQKDRQANTIKVLVQDRRDPVDLTSWTALYTMEREDGVRVVVEGQIWDNEISVTLTDACYQVAGRYAAFIRITSPDTEEKRTVLRMAGLVVNEGNGPVIDGSHIIPSLEDLLAQIAAMEAATDAANQAAERADRAVDNLEIKPEAIQAAVDAYLEENPVETVTPEEIAEVVDNALQEAKDSGEFDGPAGPPGKDGPQGAPGAPGVSITGVSIETGGVEPGGGGEQVQSDWNQTDATAPDFIRNKPFGEEKNVTIFSAENVQSVDGFIELATEKPLTISVGTKYKIVWDGVSYTCTALDDQLTFPDSKAILGNTIIVDGNDTGEPFLMAIYEQSLRVIDFGLLLGTSTVDTHSFSIVGDIIVQIDSKYVNFPVTDWNSEGRGRILNKPFYVDELETYEWDGDISGKAIIELSNGQKLCRIGESNLGYETIAYVNSLGSDGESYYEYANDERVVRLMDLVYHRTRFGVITFMMTHYPIDPGYFDLLPNGISEPGVYVRFDTNSDGSVREYTNILKIGSVETLKNAFLPNKALFKTVVTDELILKSSQSNKFFKIMVDDNGTLTVMETET